MRCKNIIIQYTCLCTVPYQTEIQFIDRLDPNMFASVDDGIKLYVGIDNGNLKSMKTGLCQTVVVWRVLNAEQKQLFCYPIGCVIIKFAILSYNYYACSILYTYECAVKNVYTSSASNQVLFFGIQNYILRFGAYFFFF